MKEIEHRYIPIEDHIRVEDRIYVAKQIFRRENIRIVWQGYKRNGSGQILFVQPGRESLATEKQLREFHAERLRD